MAKSLTIKAVTIAILTSTLLVIGCQHTPENKTDRLQYADLRDSDQDGVVNQRDICNNSPRMSEVDNEGCSDYQRVATVTDYTIEFGFDRSDIRSDQYNVLQAIVQKMSADTNTNVLLLGDTSAEGSLEYNDKLARRRAHTITQELTNNGIDPDRVKEYYFTENVEIVKETLKTRQRRTVALVYSNSLAPVDAWNIYSTDNKNEVK
ncbi:Peptidoglycan-associated lipoprotein [Sinobacterium norvegicum]|uniref:Peptidoglycan-associated lipoprotein n=1 Tax=Sinobacterium norvegicum TaxID=1641715 RepID=A0ABM9AAU4_9GAMM|nr:OmpA family protein [Sinobacterium norvegicum]CAH0990291.1 Peptidoglycan-associated lipoprotein [Sinobacterium norvegicum]